MCRVCSGIVVLIMVLLCATSSQAFDGNRKGFVMGGGLGFGPYAQWNWERGHIDEEGLGAAWNLLAGYAWQDKDMIVLEFNGVSFSSDFFGETATVLYGGPVWYHYFEAEPKGLFSAVGLWAYGISTKDGLSGGRGYVIGAGYEFMKQVQVGLYWGGGKSKIFCNYSEKGGMNHLGLIVTVVAY